MSRLAMPHEVAELVAQLPVWLRWLINWSVELANHGSPWLPDKLRRCPLKGCAMLTCWFYSRSKP